MDWLSDWFATNLASASLVTCGRLQTHIEQVNLFSEYILESPAIIFYYLPIQVLLSRFGARNGAIWRIGYHIKSMKYNNNEMKSTGAPQGGRLTLEHKNKNDMARLGEQARFIALSASSSHYNPWQIIRDQLEANTRWLRDLFSFYVHSPPGERVFSFRLTIPPVILTASCPGVGRMRRGEALPSNLLLIRRAFGHVGPFTLTLFQARMLHNFPSN